MADQVGEINIGLHLDIDDLVDSLSDIQEHIKDAFSSEASINKFEKKVQETAEAVDDVNESLDETGKAANKSGDAGNKAFGKFKKGLKGAFDELKNSQTSLGNMVKFLSNPYVAAVALATGALAKMAKAMQEGSQRNMELEAMTHKLRAVQHATGDATKIMDALASSSISAVNSFDDLVVQATQLTQFGLDADQTIDALESIGNIAVGDAAKLDTMSNAFGKIAQQGQLTEKELKSMMSAGFDPLAEMARTTGKSITQLTKEMNAGQISTQMVADAMKSATEEGGAYENVANKLALTTQNLNGTISDNALQIKANLMAPIDGFLKGFKSAWADLTGEFANFTGNLRELGAELAKSERLWSAIAMGMHLVKTHLTSLGTIIKEAFVSLLNGFKPILDLFSRFIDATNDTGEEVDVLTIIMAILNTAVQFTTNYFTLVVKVFGLIITTISSLVVAFIDLTNVVGKVGEVIWSVLTLDFDKAGKVAKSIPGMLTDAFTTAAESIGEGLADVTEQAMKLSPSAIKKSYEENLETLKKTSEDAKANARLSGEDLGHSWNQGFVETIEEGTSNTQTTLETLYHDMSAMKGQAKSAMVWLTSEEKESMQALIEQIGALTDAQVDQLNALLAKAKEAQKKFVDDAINLTQDAIGGILGIMSDLYNQQTQALQNELSNRLKILDDYLTEERRLHQLAMRQIEDDRKGLEASRAISDYEAEVRKVEEIRRMQDIEEEARLEKERLEEEHAKRQDEIAKKQHDAEKTNAIAQVFIDGAKGAMAAIASTAGAGPIGWAMGIAQAALIGTMTAAQIAVIASKQFVGAFEHGGVVPRAGYALMAEAGPEFVVNRRGEGKIVSVSGGERVYTAAQTQALLNGDAITNHNNQHTQGDTTINIYAQQANAREIAMQVSGILGTKINNRTMYG